MEKIEFQFRKNGELISTFENQSAAEIARQLTKADVEIWKVTWSSRPNSPHATKVA